MSSLPLPLFDDGTDDGPDVRPADAHDGPRTLVIHARPGQPLDKKQRAFNRLLGKVESLRRQLDERRQLLDTAVVFHAAHVAPRMREEVNLRIQAIRALRPFLQDRRLRGADRRVLSDFLADHVHALFQREHIQDADLLELFEELHGVSVAAVAQNEIDQTRAEMAEFFEGLGVDVDVPDLRPGLSDEDMAAAAASFAEQMQRGLEEAVGREDAADRPKTKRELREEAKARRIEEARRNSLGVVYKRLARALHPDLERDPTVRERKSALMQQVTAAHAANDLHTLLRLEVDVIHSDAADPARFTADTLDAYTEMLKQQAAELEAQRMELLLHPRYQDVVAGGPFGPTGVIDGPAEVQRLDVLLEGLRAAVSALTAPDPFLEVRALIEQERAMRRFAMGAGPPRRRRTRRRKAGKR